MNRIINSIVGFVLSVVIVMSVGVGITVAGSGEYPEGRIDLVGNTARSVNVKVGDKIDFTVKMTKSKQLCKVYVMYYKTDGRSPKTTNDLSKALSLTVTRGQADTYDLKGSLPTTGLPNGTYRLFMYGDQDCDDANPWGNTDNEFACDGNPTCSAYCGSKQRPFSPDGAPDEPGDLYRTSSNPAYYGSYGSVQCSPSNTVKAAGAPSNSCGEISGGPSCDEPSFATRVGECEIKACDTSGQGFDNLTFVVGAGAPTTGGGDSGGAGGSSGGTGETGGSSGGASGGNGGTASTEVVLAVTDKAGQVKSTDSKVDLKGKSLNVAAGVRSLTNNDFIDSALQSKIGSGVAIGTKTVVLTKAVNVVTGNGDLVLINSDMNVSAAIPDGTTIMGTESWGGKLKIAPVAVAGGEVPVGFKVKGQVAEVGSSDSSLVFSKPVSVSFGDAECDWTVAESKVTCDVAYKSVGQTSWTNIPKCSDGVSTNPSQLEFAKECYIPQYSSKTVKIWTYHFSQFANFSVDQPATYLMALPQVCLDKADPSKLLLQFQFGVNPAYESFIQAFTKCSSRTSCDGSEQLLTDWKTADPNQKVIDSVPVISSIYGIKVGDVLKFRVGGTLKGGTTPANIEDLADKYWSQSVFKRVSSCEKRGAGITIEELIISPQSQ